MDEIAKTQQRTRSYWFSDGIAEMVGGLAMALVGLPMIAAAKTGWEVFSTAALFGMILLFPLSARVVRYLKNRITHPRTGYVKYPRPSMSKRRRALLAAVLVAVSIVIILSLTRGNDMLEGRVWDVRSRRHGRRDDGGLCGTRGPHANAPYARQRRGMWWRGGGIRTSQASTSSRASAGCCRSLARRPSSRERTHCSSTSDATLASRWGNRDELCVRRRP